MAEIKPQRYKETAPRSSSSPSTSGARTHRAGWIYDLVRLITTRSRSSSTAARDRHRQRPRDGPVILAPNHFSNMDHFFAGVYIRRRIRFMAKSQLFRQQPGARLHLPGRRRVPGVRGHHDEEAFITAHSILDHGGCVLIYAEGGRSRTGSLGEAKPGVGRLALESGVPVVPVAIHGSQGVRRWKRLEFPKVTVQYGEPISLPTVERRPASSSSRPPTRSSTREGDVRGSRSAAGRA